MSNKLVVFDSHPVQYRVPVWRKLNELLKGDFHVVYASDCSVRGHEDTGFGRTVAWDDPMLDGYSHTVLNCEKGKPLSNRSSLTGQGVATVMDQLKPSAILLTGFNYKYDIITYRAAKKRGIPVWLRCETQDEAVERSPFKAIVRSLIYRFQYKGLDKVFYIGELNKQHYIRHGVPERKLIAARYGTVDRFAEYSDTKKSELRKMARAAADIAEQDIVIGFSGKFIAKKNPDILFSMLSYLPDNLRKRIHIYFIGSGEMEQKLKQLSVKTLEEYHIKTFFSGFVNQSELAQHYLAVDILVLPSRRMGETWGLVSNEAMQAGCSVIVSDAVGSGVDFKYLDQFKVFSNGYAKELAEAVVELANYPRTFDWAAQALVQYSLDSTAEAIASVLKK